MTTDNESPIEEAVLVSLGQKLAALDLTDPEREALGVLLSDDDVAGFGRYNIANGIRLGYRLPSTSAGVRAQGIRAKGVRQPGIGQPGIGGAGGSNGPIKPGQF